MHAEYNHVWQLFARSGLCAFSEASSGSQGVQGQVQWEELPCDQQRASSHSNSLFTKNSSLLCEQRVAMGARPLLLFSNT